MSDQQTDWNADVWIAAHTENKWTVFQCDTSQLHLLYILIVAIVICLFRKVNTRGTVGN